MARANGFGLAAGSMWRRAALWACVVGLAVWGAAALPAQDDGTPTLHVYPNLLQIPTLVVDHGHEPVPGIPESRFFVSLDGGPKFRVTHARPEGDDPISLAIVLDLSQPFPALVAKMDDVIAGLAPLSLHPQDRVSIYSMDCNLIRSVNDVPADAATLRRGVDIVLKPWRTSGRERWRSVCKSPTNLWDSLRIVTQALFEHPGRRVMLVVTDGVDRGSKTGWNELRQYAQSRAVAIFGLVQTGDSNRGLMVRNPEDTFNMVCDMTGGMVMTAEQKSIAEQMQQFMELLRGRYIVEFPHPVDTKGGYHDMYITIEKSDAYVLPTGIGVPADNPAVLQDPRTVPLDPSGAPQLGKRKVLSPN
jgi:hypothetical protein